MSRKLNVYLCTGEPSPFRLGAGCGEKIGILTEDDLLQLSFQYDNETRALSVSLPVRDESYPHANAFPFFENLTPEGEAFEILTKDHVSEDKVFSILDRFGGDCAGAVALYETMPDNDDQDLREISSSQMAQIIDKLPQDPLLTGIDNPPRLSLAGAQSKFAVYKSDGKYYRSSDKYPTTHIIKIANRRFPGLLENELFCMKLAKIILSNVPDVALMETEGRQYLEITRYDRYMKNGIARRIHQEDFCQALGIVSGKKYQAGGGAKLKDCYEVINEFSENRFTDIIRFMEWIIFNYLIGNTDAHAKNLSILHSDDGIMLAPFYDLLSTEVYPENIVDHEMAMLINGKGKYSSLKPKDFIALFENLNQNATNMMRTLKDIFENIVPAAEELRESLSPASIHDEIIALIKKRFNILF
ncbi:MAG: type II toxin-antitoxin system HipA family toxin [Treponema sp.]|nr:type II toxin-antitoxin system HipA family toxin [Treponema sp.]